MSPRLPFARMAAMLLAVASPGLSYSAAAESHLRDGSTPLLMAVYEANAQEVAKQLKAGADPRQANQFGATPLAEAARIGDTAILELLLRAGVNPSESNVEGQTALHAVARTGNVAAAKLLVKAGADVDAREHWGGQTALIWAASQNHPEMIRYLISKGANPNAKATVRDWQRRVTAEGRPKDMNHGGFSALHYAARDGHLDATRALLASGADINQPDPDGTTPLLLTLINGHWDNAKLLIESGANVNDWDFWGQSPLYLAVDMRILPQGARTELPSMDAATGLDIIKLLLAKGANPNAQLKLRPPYRQAVFDRGADATLIAGATPLMRAATGGDVEITQLLIEAGAHVDLPNEEQVTPLFAAIMAVGTRGRSKTEEQALQVVERLRAAGAQVNVVSNRGLTPVHSAAFRGWNSMLKALAGYGANLDARESDQLTPLDYALGRSRVGFLQTKPPVRPETANLLRELGAKIDSPNLPPWPGVGTPGIRAIVPE